MADNNQLQIFRPENVQLITSNAPQALTDNQQSHDRCLAACNAILQLIQQHGMTDEIDQQAASFIDKARKTVQRCNERRSPFTKLFDEIRTQFTALENDIDPTKKGTVPFQLQQYRNEYAARKRAEEEQRRRAAIAEQQRLQAEARYRTDCEADYNRIFNAMLNGALNNIMQLYNEVTLDNYDQKYKHIEQFIEQLPEQLITSARSSVLLPPNVSADRLKQIRSEVIFRLLPTFSGEFCAQIANQKAEYLAMLPSKRQELQRASEASAEEAERIRKQIAERDAAEQARKQQELAAQQQQAAMAQQQAAMAGAFDASAAAMPSYQPKTSVKKIIEVSAPSGFQSILNLWWVEEGQFLSLEELAKMFKKQVSFVVKLANDKENPRFINDPAIRYVEDVKAK